MPTCLNCGNERAENFCPQCGQRAGSRLQIKAFVRDVVDDQFSVDAKIPRTLGPLFLKPGLLTTEFIEGRAARYIPPFRLYLLTSLLFFLLLSFLSNRSDWAERAERQFQEQKDSATVLYRAARDSAARASGDTSAAPADTSERLNVGVTVGGKPWLQDAEVNLPWKWLDERVEANLAAMNKLPPSVAMRRVVDATVEELPKVMFVLLPVFALLLKLLYARRNRFYIEHFVFALHLHALTFILFSVALVIRAEWTIIALWIILPVYTFLAMKRVYQQGWFKTTFKWATLGLVYSVLLITGLMFAFIWALAATPATA
jgi:hypothetical protein